MLFLSHPTNLGCGIVNKKHRIVGGHETEVNQYPWMGLMQYNGRFYCGASLINDRYVLTGKEEHVFAKLSIHLEELYVEEIRLRELLRFLIAAHCVQGFQARRITVVLLDHNRAKPDESTLITRKVGMSE